MATSARARRRVAAHDARGAFAAAAMALVAVVMGGLTAKMPGASVACLTFPLCGANPDVRRERGARAAHASRASPCCSSCTCSGMLMAPAPQGERDASCGAPPSVAFSLGMLQLLVAGAMIGMHLPPVLRSLHEATGVSIWIATFALAYLARIASGGAAIGARVSDRCRRWWMPSWRRSALAHGARRACLTPWR